MNYLTTRIIEITQKIKEFILYFPRSAGPGIQKGTDYATGIYKVIVTAGTECAANAGAKK